MFVHSIAVEQFAHQGERFPAVEEITKLVLEYAAERFRKERLLDQHFVMHATRPTARLMILHPETNDPSIETLKGSAWIVRGIRELAKEHGGRALWMMGESWVSHDDKYSAQNGSEPRLDPKREERVIVLLETPYARPPIQTWNAPIERNKGRPHLGPWNRDSRIVNGRLTYLLPPDAYGAVGST